MWSIYLAFVVFILIINLLATILHLCKVIDANSALIHFSVIKNIEAVIPKRRVEQNSKHTKAFLNPADLVDGVRQLWQIVLLITHFPMMIWPYDILKIMNNKDNLQYFINCFFNIYSRTGLGCFFMINGIASGKYLLHQITRNKNESFLRLCTRFYLERFLMIAPIFYLYFLACLYQFQFVADRLGLTNITNVCSDAIVPNMLFLMNFLNRNEPVR